MPRAVLIMFLSFKILLSQVSTLSVGLQGNCSGTLTFLDDIDSFRTNSLPGTYVNNLDCKWNVSVPSLLKVTIIGSSEAGFDFITLYSSPSSSIALSGEINAVYIITGPFYAIFHSDSTVVESGVEVSWEPYSFAGNCSGTLMLFGESGSFKSNTLPGTYDNNVHCSWVVNVSSGSHEITIVGETETLKDVVTIYLERKNNTITLSGTFNVTYCFSGPFYVTFTTDSSVVASGFEFTWQPCSASEVNTSNPSTGLSVEGSIGIGVSVGVVVLVVLLLIIIYVVRIHGGTTDHTLPPELLKFSERTGSGWKQDKSVPSLWRKKIEPKTKDYAIFSSIFEEHLNGKEYKIASVKMVNNENIWGAFSAYYPIMINRIRSDPATFDKKEWEQKSDADLRRWYVEEYHAFCMQFEWNEGAALPIIPSVHGTSGAIAKKICENGFVALSILDQGFYGKGIYFTCHALYAIPYTISKKSPTLIISLIVPANIYPVTEHPEDPNSFLGGSLVAGHQSHFVLTGINGCPIKEIGQKYYTEIVIAQESQIVPIYLVQIDTSCLNSLGMKWARVTAEDKQEQDLLQNEVKPATDVVPTEQCKEEVKPVTDVVTTEG
eukprot:TRINITY_DN3640_c0_g1_i1.p1 TRINITY_DN3640_c0_g1~~TRINITY_DN3640_c0_g1_i1.p1  ORF type:complete len:605 (+),score=126.66 TRINITY_DN3640_c0_g1_i1:111-1925(+)